MRNRAQFRPTWGSAQGDLYFTPCVFTGTKRHNDKALDSRWLYADLDEVDPRTLPDTIRPTIAIQTSPGRFQALWFINRALTPQQHAKVNQRLTYAIGADKGGWHASKVLRVPGTINYKYRGRPKVRLMWFHSQAVPLKNVLNFIKNETDVDHVPADISTAPPELPNTTAAHLRRRYRKRLGRRARKLLLVKSVTKGEDRSSRIWELENLCLDAGLSPEETLILVQATVWNKYKGQRREVRMLWTEIQKCMEARRRKLPPDGDERSYPKPHTDDPEQGQGAEPEDDDTEESTPLDIAPMRLAKYLARDVRPPSWLVEHIWGRAAHGVWAGDFKTYKSTLLMDLAVSVASGRPFLGKFDVNRTGPVLYIQEENSHGFMHDRLHRIVQAKGLGNIVHKNGKPTRPTIEFGHDLDLFLLNLSGFDLTKSSHLAALNKWCHMRKPALVILDPLYRLAPGVDENSQHEMAPILNALADISNANDSALVLAHHYNKPNAGNAGMRSGHRISGTSVFSRWWESSVYAERSGDPESYSIKFHNEHREHGSAAPQVVTVEMTAEDPESFSIYFADPADTADDGDSTNGSDPLKLDSRTERVPVMTVRSQLKLGHSREAQALLKAKGYKLRKVKNKLYAYPPAR